MKITSTCLNLNKGIVNIYSIKLGLPDGAIDHKGGECALLMINGEIINKLFFFRQTIIFPQRERSMGPFLMEALSEHGISELEIGKKNNSVNHHAYL